MDVLFWMFIGICILAALSFIVTALAALTIFMGPPDAHDVDIVGTPRKESKKIGSPAENTDR